MEHDPELLADAAARRVSCELNALIERRRGERLTLICRWVAVAGAVLACINFLEYGEASYLGLSLAAPSILAVFLAPLILRSGARWATRATAWVTIVFGYLAIFSVVATQEGVLATALAIIVIGPGFAASFLSVADTQRAAALGVGLTLLTYALQKHGLVGDEYASLEGWRGVPEVAGIVAIMFCTTLVNTQFVQSFHAIRRRLEAATVAAEAANTAKSQFLATMSHEMRTPLNGVAGMTEVLAHTNLNSDQREMVQVIKRSAIALNDVFEDVLDFSQMEKGRLSLALEPFEVADLADLVTTVARARSAPDAGDVRISVEIAEDVAARYVGDYDRIAQILINLMDNALKFTEQGEIRLSIERDLLDLRFRVADTGAGVPSEKLDMIFERFTQIDQSDRRLRGGSGLGLSISRQLARLMGGDVEAESRLGEGSTFTLSLPLQPARDDGDRA